MGRKRIINGHKRNSEKECVLWACERESERESEREREREVLREVWGRNRVRFG